jgi:methionine sulfoxide reductase heme-binding subunit
MIAAIATIATLAIYAWIYHLQAQGRSPAALAMSSMGMRNMSKFWAFPILQASGLVGLAFAYASVGLGLLQSAKPIRRLGMSPATVDRIHRQISLTVLALVALHVVATAADAMGDSWRTVLLPNGWATSWPAANWAYNLGVLALYTLVILGPSYYLRGRIGRHRWRIAHRFILLFYVASVWHALILGLDVSYYGWLRPTIYLAQIPLLLLLAHRLREPLRRATGDGARARAGRIARACGVVAAGVVSLALFALVVTGHADLIATV